MQENVKISKIDKKKKQTIKKKKNFTKKNWNCYIFSTNVSKWKYIKCWSASNERLCSYFYVDPTIQALLQA